MINLLLSCAIGCLHIQNVLALLSLSPTFRSSPPIACSSRKIAPTFAIRQPSHHRHNQKIIDNQRILAQQRGPGPRYASSHSSSPYSSTSLLLMPSDPYHLSEIAAPLTLCAAASSFFMASPKEEEVGAQPMSSNNSDDEILTPETYADSTSAEIQVEDIITTKASGAFASTDFDTEPHLAPELENCGLDFDELIDNPTTLTKADVFQRKLLSEQLANSKSSAAAKAKKMEAFHRCLLSTRIAYEMKAKESIAEVEHQRKEEWMGSEVLAASMGKVSALQASSVVANAMAEAEHAAEEKQDEVIGKSNSIIPPAAMVADTAERMILGEDIALVEHSPESSMKLIQEEVKVAEKEVELDKDTSVHDLQQSYLSAQREVLSEVDQWKQDYVSEVRKYVNRNAIQKTKERMSQRSRSVHDIDREYNEIAESIDVADDENVDLSINTVADTTPTKDLQQETMNSEGDSVIKRALQRGFVRRMRQRRNLLAVSLAVVLGRRLLLAWVGNALSLI